jgi:hypothetical protein
MHYQLEAIKSRGCPGKDGKKKHRPLGPMFDGGDDVDH